MFHQNTIKQQATPSIDQANSPILDTPITKLLMDWQNGESRALDEIIDHCYGHIRQMALRILRNERHTDTLQYSGLISEAYLRLRDLKNIHWQNREQFFSAWAGVMRRVLVDYARSQNAAKRGGDYLKLSLHDVKSAEISIDALDLDKSLAKLEKFDQQACLLVELRCFVGLKNAEIADVLNISLATVKRRWRMAQTWLFREMVKE